MLVDRGSGNHSHWVALKKREGLALLVYEPHPCFLVQTTAVTSNRDRDLSQGARRVSSYKKKAKFGHLAIKLKGKMFVTEYQVYCEHWLLCYILHMYRYFFCW